MVVVAPSHSELDRMADDLLAADLRSELCRECDGRGVKLGREEACVVHDKIGADTLLRAILARYVCEQGHVWYAGEGKPRGRGGDSPILLDEHYAHRRSKEAYMADGIVDDFVRPGMFHRDHVDK